MKMHAAAVAALFATPVVALGACSNQPSNNSAGTTTTRSSGQSLTAQMNSADGKRIADATIDFTGGYATVTVESAADSGLAPGFHGLHIHAVGTCEGDFNSAGDHFQASGHTGQPASGDLPPLLVRSDGAGKLVATSDAFTLDQLKGAQGSSIVLHQTADMSGQGSAASDARIACGVLSPASGASTSVSTSVSTSTITTEAPPAPATVTETTSPAATTASTTSPSTSTSTVTVTQSSTTTAPPPMAPGG